MSAFAQTDYDIRVFLDNVKNETPKAEQLSFYLGAGNKLKEAGNYDEANILYDFAASLGSVEGFSGKAQTEDGALKERHLYFSQNKTAASRRLISALSHSDKDILSALIVHDNLSVFNLSFLRDPLLDWMPSSPNDTLFLRQNDDITYMIACLKEEDGKILEALGLYDLAAWQGNYEALKKSRHIGGNREEINCKKILIKRMEKDEAIVSLHKFYEGERMTGNDYRLIRDYLSNDNDLLVSLAAKILS